MSHDNKHRRMSRRGALRLAGGLAVAGAAGGAAVAGEPDTGGAPAPAPTPEAEPARTFTHPGLLHAYGELNRAKVRVARGDNPWLVGWQRLTANRHAQAGWRPNPQATIIRGGEGQNYATLYHDLHAAYQNALRWKIGGTREHGDTARDILNAWSATLTQVTGNADRFLAAGLYGWQFANAAELVRDYDGFDLPRFQHMLKNVFHPPQRAVPHPPQRRLHHRLLGQQGPVHHGLRHGHRHRLRRHRPVRPGRRLLQERRGQRRPPQCRPLRVRGPGPCPVARVRPRPGPTPSWASARWAPSARWPGTRATTSTATTTTAS